MNTYGHLVWSSVKKNSKPCVGHAYSDASSDFYKKISVAAAIVQTKDEQFSDTKRCKFNYDITVCEAEGLLVGLRMAFKMGCTHVVCHLDCETLMRNITTPTGRETDIMRHKLREIRKEFKNFDEVRLVLSSRFSVSDAHDLALSKLRVLRKNIT